MRKFVLILAAAAFIPAAYAETAPPRAPDNLVIIACRAEPKTKFTEVERPIPNVNYQQLYVNSGQELECQRIVMENLLDKPTLLDPETTPLDSNFGVHAQCVRAGMQVSSNWEQQNPGWLTVAVGCPTPIAVDGVIVNWKDPECPSSIAGLPVTCRFDKSNV